MRKWRTLSSLLIALFFSLSMAACASRVVYVRHAPPPARVEVRPAKPFAGAVWISGYWRWNGARYVWVSGRWVKPRPGKVWVPGHWKKTRHGWYYVPGHWK